MLVREVMTHPVVTVAASDGVAVASQILISHGFTGLPVVDEDGRLVGIVTEADLLSGRIPDDPRRAGRGPHRTASSRAGATVGAVMSTPVESLTPGADVADAVRMVVEERLRCVPIVDGTGLVGIVTRRDLLRSAVAHEDADVRTAILHRLHALDRRDRWGVDVSGGAAVITDYMDDARDREAAGAIAVGVPGVARVEVHHETPDPT